jgi:hypothetical protein
MLNATTTTETRGETPAPTPRKRVSDKASREEKAAKDVGEEIREQGGFLEIVCASGSDEAGPVLEFGTPVPRTFRQVEGPHLLAEDLGVE